jgi:hypothetical protein
MKLVGRSLLAGAAMLAGAAVTQITLVAQAPQSPAVAKEVADLMVKAKVECVVAEHRSVFGGYVAGLLIPGAKLTVVTARFADTTAMAYKVYHKQCMEAYADLSAAIDALDRVVVDDIGADGLVAMPKKDMPLDGFTKAGKTTKFNGDPKVLKQQKTAPADFDKSFAEADTAYAELLRLLAAELKK